MCERSVGARDLYRGFCQRWGAAFIFSFFSTGLERFRLFKLLGSRRSSQVALRERCARGVGCLEKINFVEFCVGVGGVCASRFVRACYVPSHDRSLFIRHLFVCSFFAFGMKASDTSASAADV